jgi:hypothetical protein
VLAQHSSAGAGLVSGAVAFWLPPLSLMEEEAMQLQGKHLDFFPYPLGAFGPQAARPHSLCSRSCHVCRSGGPRCQWYRRCECVVRRDFLKDSSIVIESTATRPPGMRAPPHGPWGHMDMEVTVTDSERVHLVLVDW